MDSKNQVRVTTQGSLVSAGSSGILQADNENIPSLI